MTSISANLSHLANSATIKAANDTPIEAHESTVTGITVAIANRGNEAMTTALRFDDSSRVLVSGAEGVTDPEQYLKRVAG